MANPIRIRTRRPWPKDARALKTRWKLFKGTWRSGLASRSAHPKTSIQWIWIARPATTELANQCSRIFHRCRLSPFRIRWWHRLLSNSRSSSVTRNSHQRTSIWHQSGHQNLEWKEHRFLERKSRPWASSSLVTYSKLKHWQWSLSILRKLIAQRTRNWSKAPRTFSTIMRCPWSRTWTRRARVSHPLVIIRCLGAAVLRTYWPANSDQQRTTTNSIQIISSLRNWNMLRITPAGWTCSRPETRGKRYLWLLKMGTGTCCSRRRRRVTMIRSRTTSSINKMAKSTITMRRPAPTIMATIPRWT